METILDETKYDFVVDCIDSVLPKLTLIKACRYRKIKIISAMGAGGKTNPSLVMVRDISKTNNCYLAKQIRKRLKREYPNSELSKLAIDLRGKLAEESKELSQLQKEIEKRKASLTEKQKKIAEKEAERQQTEEQLIKQDKAQKQAQQTLRDSAKIATPAPNINLPIK
jgi:tRNA A37 threonylcarbamoyladenosine dehydratase